MSEKKNLFCLEHVSKVFQDKNLEVTAVNDVSLCIEEGEIFGIIGMSGAGKTHWQWNRIRALRQKRTQRRKLREQKEKDTRSWRWQNSASR